MRVLTCNGGCSRRSLEPFLQAGQRGLILLVFLGPTVGEVCQGDELGVEVVGNEVPVPLVGEVDQSLRKERGLSGRLQDSKCFGTMCESTCDKELDFSVSDPTRSSIHWSVEGLSAFLIKIHLYCMDGSEEVGNQDKTGCVSLVCLDNGPKKQRPLHRQ